MCRFPFHPFALGFLPRLALHGCFRRNRRMDARLVIYRVMIPPTVIIFQSNFPARSLVACSCHAPKTLIQICGLCTTFGNLRTKANRAVDLLNSDPFAVFQREQRVHQAIHGVDVRNRDGPGETSSTSAIAAVRSALGVRSSDSYCAFAHRRNSAENPEAFPKPSVSSP